MTGSSHDDVTLVIGWIYIFLAASVPGTEVPDGAFEAFPVNNWYNFMPLAKGRMLTAEEEWERRNPVRNHLCIKQQPRWKDQEEDEKEKPGARKPLSCTSVTWRGPKVKKKGPPSKGVWKKKKGSDDEAFEVSDNGDFKGQEVDNMSASRSNSQEELEGKPKVTQQEESPKGMDKQSMSCNERQKETLPQEDKKVPMPREKKQRKHSSEESDINRETSLAAASKLEQGKQTIEMTVAEGLRLDTGPQSLSGKSTPSNGDMQVTKDAGP
ncbi:General transcription factor IIF subunit 1 [Bos mutus]|uniref:Transcription initiation factor IIF subunit alpha n=1 Tax=Bos mutus TaxID=72004 RepID=L8HQU5_9CETA|nr:General transcription factor IIF subunit 1 [Bos mutus]